MKFSQKENLKVLSNAPLKMMVYATEMIVLTSMYCIGYNVLHLMLSEQWTEEGW